MRIDRTTQQAAEAYGQRVEQTAEQVQRSRGDAAPSRSVDVQLSARSRELQRVRELAQQAPDVRRERVAALKAAIEAGTYHVPAEQIAAKLLAGGLNAES